MAPLSAHHNAETVAVPSADSLTPRSDLVLSTGILIMVYCSIRYRTVCLILLSSAVVVSSFSRPSFLHSQSTISSGTQSRVSVSVSETTTGEFDKKEATDKLRIPLSFNEMTRQAASAASDAYATNVTRQILRVLLPRDPYSGQLGQYFEADAEIDTEELILAPPDETWQGGIMQLYRAAVPTCQTILRLFSSNAGGLPPKMREDRSVDESGVDGVGLWITENVSPADDVSCFVQPTQETVDAVEAISKQAGERLVMLLNPQWRFADDALDSFSKEEGVLGSLASFLGGKGNSLRRLDEMKFEYVYILEGYVCKGGNIRLIKRFDSDWAVFAENDSATDYIKVGTSKSRPTYQDVDRMLDEKGISVKYARDLGMKPKL